MTDSNLTKKTVRELKLNDYVVVDAQTGVQKIELSVGEQLGEELATLSVDGEEFTIRAPKAEALPEIKFVEAEAWTDKTSLVAGQLIVGETVFEVRVPTDLLVYSNESAQYQTKSDIDERLSGYYAAADIDSKLADKADLSEVVELLSAKANAVDVAATAKYLSDEILSNSYRIDEISSKFVPAQLANYALLSDFSLLSSQHKEEIVSANNRIDAIGAGLRGDGTAIISELKTQIFELSTRLDNIEASGSGEAECSCKKLAGQKFAIEESSLSELLEIVLKALGANGGDGPLSGKLYEIDESSAGAILRDVLEALGAEVVDTAAAETPETPAEA